MLPGGRGEEFVIIAALALIIIGPKDLPKVLREIGKFVGKMRRMADEFKTSFEDMARQSELDELRKEVDALRASKMPGLDSLKQDMQSIHTDLNSSLALPGNTTSAIPGTDIPGDAILPEPAPEPGLNPQMQGLPPVTPSAPQPAPEPVVTPEPVVVKPRARKAADIKAGAKKAATPKPTVTS